MEYCYLVRLKIEYTQVKFRHISKVGTNKCSMCFLVRSTSIQLIKGFDSIGILTCNNIKCIMSALEQVDNIFAKYPVFRLSLDNLMHPNPLYSLSNRKFLWSTSIILHEHNIDDMNYSSIGQVFFYQNKMFITIGITLNSKSLMQTIELKKLLEFNDINPSTINLKDLLKYNNIDSKSLSLSDDVKKYFGIQNELTICNLINELFKLQIVN